MKKSDFGDIIEVVIILAILSAGLVYTLYGLFDGGSISGSHNRYYEIKKIKAARPRARGAGFCALTGLIRRARV